MSGILFVLFAASAMLFYATFNYVLLLKKVDRKFETLRSKLKKRTVQFAVGAVTSLLAGMGLWFFI